MTYQIIYSSQSTIPMQSDDLEELLEQARSKNAVQGISGVLVYSDESFLQILEGDSAKLQALMTDIRKDVRHTDVTVLREGEIPAARFASWKMAYVSATSEQAARWAGVGARSGGEEGTRDVGEELRRTASFVRELLALLAPEEEGGTTRHDPIEPGDHDRHDRSIERT